MTDKPTGVFVRLPLSDAEKMALTSGVKWGGDIESGILAIGAPVTETEECKGIDKKKEGAEFILNEIARIFSRENPGLADGGFWEADARCALCMLLESCGLLVCGEPVNQEPAFWMQSEEIGDLSEVNTICITGHRTGYYTTPVYFLATDTADALSKIAERDAEIARLRKSAGLARENIKDGSPMKAAYVLEAALKGPEA